MIKKLLHKYQKTSDLNRFIVKALPLFLIWRGFRKWLILYGDNSEFSQYLSTVYLKLAHFFLNIIGKSNTVDYPSRKLWIDGSAEAIYVAYDCLGINLLFVFTIFLMAYPGKLKMKAWFIPLGLLMIFMLNSIRMAALAILLNCCPEKMDFYHHFVFQGIIYAGIFGLWWTFFKLNNQYSSIK